MAFPWLAFLPASSDDDLRTRTGRDRAPSDRSAALQLLQGNDAVLVARIRSGDAIAMDALFTAYYPELVSFAMAYLRVRETAEDVVQDVFVRVWERRAEWTVRGSVAQYLYGSVRNRALNVLAHDRITIREADRVVREQTAEASSVGNAGATDIEADELAVFVTQVVDGLPPRCREVFVLSRYRRLSQQEIATTLGITLNTVNAQLGRALRTLDAALRARESDIAGSRKSP